MLIYNVTVNIDYEVHQDWVQWMREVHIPDVMATACFVESRFSKVMVDHDQGGETYSIQYLAKSQEDLDRYQKEHAAALQKDHTQKFEGKFAAFRTLLNVVEQYHG